MIRRATALIAIGVLAQACLLEFPRLGDRRGTPPGDPLECGGDGAPFNLELVAIPQVIVDTTSVGASPMAELLAGDLQDDGFDELMLLRSEGLFVSDDPTRGSVVVVATPTACDWFGLASVTPYFQDASPAGVERAFITEIRGEPTLAWVWDGVLASLRFDPGTQRFRNDDEIFRLSLRVDDPRGIAAGDIDGNGLTDLVVVGGAQARTLRLGLDQSSPDAVGMVDVEHGGRAWLADFDGDGHLDLLAGPDLSLPPPSEGWPDDMEFVGQMIFNDGEGRLELTTRGAVGFDALSLEGPVAVGDFDRDGDVDLLQWRVPRSRFTGERESDEVILELVRRGESLDTIEIARGEGALLEGESLRGVPAVADLDLDGFPDVVVAAPGALLVVRGGTSPELVRFPMPIGLSPTAPFRVALSDLEGDGDVDVITLVDFEGNASPIRFRNTTGHARSVSVQLDVSAAGTELCLYARDMLPPPDERCGRAEGLLAHHLGVHSTAQRGLGQAIVLGVPEGTTELDLRVVERGTTPIARDFRVARGQRFVLAAAAPSM